MILLTDSYHSSDVVYWRKRGLHSIHCQ